MGGRRVESVAVSGEEEEQPPSLHDLVIGGGKSLVESKEQALCWVDDGEEYR